MKLISCHIEHFGKWSDQTFSFADGCNIFCRENGWGKSMLAVFIRTMFYGFSGGKLRDDLLNERKRYQPWQGGLYGGSVKFEASGKVYELTRMFGTKEKEDRFELRDAATNLKSDDFSENIGEELFGLDRVSFCRTVFITQNDCQTEATDGVNAKLGNLSGEKDDLMNYESMNQRLTDLINGLSPARKTGELAKRKEEIAGLKDLVRFGPAVDKDILAEQVQKEALERELAERKTERTELMKRQQELFAGRERLIRRNQYGELCREAKERLDDRERAQEVFPGELPDAAELERYIAECTALIAEKKAVEMFSMTEEDLQQLEQDKELFAPGRPSDEVFDRKDEQAEEYRRLHWERQTDRPTQEEEEKLAQFEKLLGAEIPDREELRAVEEDWRLRASDMSVLVTKSDYLHRMAAMAKMRAQEDMLRRQKDKKRLMNRSFICLGTMLVILSVAVVMIVGHWKPGLWVGLCLLPIGIAAGVIGIWGIRRANAMDVGEKPIEEEMEILALKREIRIAEQTAAIVERETEKYLTRWNCEYREDTVLSELARLADEAEEYRMLREKAENYRESRIEERLEELHRELNRFVKIYYPEASITEQNVDEWLTKLRRARDRYNDLRERKRLFEVAEKKYCAHGERITGYIRSLSMEVQEDLTRQLQEIRTGLQQYQLRTKEWEKAEARRSAFEAENEPLQLEGPTEEELFRAEEDTAVRLNAVEYQLEALQTQIRQKDAMLDELREKRDGISSADDMLEIRREEYRERENYFRALKLTKELLEKAKTSFTAKYTGPIMLGFAKYYEMLTGQEPSGHYLDANLKLTVTEQGMQRETKAFSEGWKDLLGICMRMALVDAMYREEKPMVVFDDPFVNLDREKTEAALKFLEEISKEYQVIYFTCHESRM